MYNIVRLLKSDESGGKAQMQSMKVNMRQGIQFSWLSPANRRILRTNEEFEVVRSLSMRMDLTTGASVAVFT